LQGENVQNKLPVSSCRLNCITGNQQPVTLQKAQNYTLQSIDTQNKNSDDYYYF